MVKVEVGAGSESVNFGSSESANRWRGNPTPNQIAPSIGAFYDHVDTLFVDESQSADSLNGPERARAILTSTGVSHTEEPTTKAELAIDSPDLSDSDATWPQFRLHAGVALVGVLFGIATVVMLANNAAEPFTSIAQHHIQDAQPAVARNYVQKVTMPLVPDNRTASNADRADVTAVLKIKSEPVATNLTRSGLQTPDTTGNSLQATAKTISDTPIPVDGRVAMQTHPPMRIPAIAHPKPLGVDTERRLLAPLDSIVLAGAKLDDVITFAAEFSTIPITLNADAMMQANVKLSTPVFVELNATTIGDMLRSAITSLGLDYSISGNHLLIHRMLPPDGLMRVEEYGIEDLVRRMPRDEEQLLQMVQDFVSPDSWEARGGEGRISLDGGILNVQQDEPSHFEIIRLCEKLRVARGVDVRSRYPHRLFQLTPRYEQAVYLLKTPVLVQHWEARPFGKIVADLANATDCQILVDWHALEAECWNHHLEFPFVVETNPLSQALEQLLEPLNLTYRIESADMLVITTEAAELRQMDVEMYRMNSLHNSPQNVSRQIQEAVGREHFMSTGGTGRVLFDQTSQCLIVRLPQSRQRVVAESLNELRP